MSKEKGNPNLESVISDLEKRYGEGVILSNEHGVNDVKAISTGSFAIDGLLGCGGLPLGRMIEVYGKESSGKTSLTLFLAGQIQKQGGKVAFLDVEQTFDSQYAESLGVDVSKLVVAQPSTLEETMDILRALVTTNEIDLIIVDSIAAMIPKRELEEGALEKDSMALKARLMSKYLPVITSELARSKTIAIFINQLRDNVGVMFGAKETTPGGKALKFFSSVRLQVFSKEAIKRGNDQIGNVMRIVAKKNKVGPPFRETEIDLYYGKGIDLVSDTLLGALEYGVVTRRGNTYEYGSEKLGVGVGATREALKENVKIYEEIREKTYKAISSGEARVEDKD